jgi:hypothetical protein
VGERDGRLGQGGDASAQPGSRKFVSSPRRAWQSVSRSRWPGGTGSSLPLVLVALAVEILLLYGRSITDSLVADDWNIIEARTSSLGAAVALEPLGPHFLPLQYLILFTLRQMVGINPVAYHLTVLSLVWVSAGLVVLLGRHLIGSLGAGALAGILFVAYGTHFEAILWPAAGVSYTLATVLVLAGLLTYIRAHDRTLAVTARRLAYAGFVAAVVLAPFAYPLGITLILAAALYRLLIIERGVGFHRDTIVSRLRAWAGDFVIPAAIVVAYLLLLRWLKPEKYTATESTPSQAQVQALAKSLFQLAIPGVGQSSSTRRWDGIASSVSDSTVAGLDLWTIILVLVLAIAGAAVGRFGKPRDRLLVAWIVTMAGAMVFGLGTVFPRHLFLIAAPASILWVSMLRDLGRLLRGVLARLDLPARLTNLLAIVPSAAILLTFLGLGATYTIEQRETWTAAMAQVDDVMTQIDRLTTANPSATDLYLINLRSSRPSGTGEPVYMLPAWSAAATVNVTFPRRFRQVVIVSTDQGRGAGLTATDEQLGAVATNPRALLLEYERKTNRLHLFKPDHPTEINAPPLAPGAGAIDLAGGQPAKSASVVAGQPVEVVGWAVAAGRKAAAAVFMTVDGKARVKASYGQDRADVASGLGPPTPRQVGFVATIPADDLPVGQHTIGLLVLSAEGGPATEISGAAVVEVTNGP